jgi:UDP-N-acetylglucosamine 1-carboxyvinyltransferase
MVEIYLPGGCAIGKRPIDQHIKGLNAMNINLCVTQDKLKASYSQIIGNEINLDIASVGATINLILASMKTNKPTIIKNAAKEPEIVDLQNFLIKCGAKISGAGTSTITIEGTKNLKGVEYSPIKDRIVAGTYLLAVCMCGGELILNGANYDDLRSLTSKLSKYACKIVPNSDNIYIKVNERMSAVDIIETSPYPGFPTDLQAQTVAMLSVSSGTSVMVENMFETRFKYVPELVKMGAKIVVRGRNALIKGVSTLKGAEVVAHDLRGGAALILAGLCANGQTIVHNVHHVDRGYENLEQTLRKVGADITRE